MKTTVIPAPHQVFCKPLKTDTKSKSGFQTTANKEGQNIASQAEIISVGNEVSLYKKGIKFIYRAYASLEVEIDNETFFLIEDVDILATIQ